MRFFTGTSAGLKQFIKRQAKAGFEIKEEAGSMHLGKGVWIFRVSVTKLLPKAAKLDKKQKI